MQAAALDGREPELPSSEKAGNKGEEEALRVMTHDEQRQLMSAFWRRRVCTPEQWVEKERRSSVRVFNS